MNFLQISRYSQEDLKTCNFMKKETPTQVFSCDYHKLFENRFSYGIPPLATSERFQLSKDLYRRIYKRERQRHSTIEHIK